ASTLTGAEAKLTAYVLEQKGGRRVAIINKDNEAIGVELPSRVRASAMRLSGPGLESTEGTVFGEVRVARARDVLVEAHSAMIYEL
ncbi:MAG TPA: hypothetical protein VF865_21090, partial [Acidobacteriaceae bacterium]